MLSQGRGDMRQTWVYGRIPSTLSRPAISSAFGSLHDELRCLLLRSTFGSQRGNDSHWDLSMAAKKKSTRKTVPTPKSSKPITARPANKAARDPRVVPAENKAAPLELSDSRTVPFPVVGIGASAGGLEAFTEFLRAIGPKGGMAFVVVSHLAPRGDTRGPHMPIDVFLRSLAISRKSRAVGVILSGTATDGTLGLKAIKG